MVKRRPPPPTFRAGGLRKSVTAKFLHFLAHFFVYRVGGHPFKFDGLCEIFGDELRLAGFLSVAADTYTKITTNLSPTGFAEGLLRPPRLIIMGHLVQECIE
jgi:hypothetical protein